jgi:hypothetical protein
MCDHGWLSDGDYRYCKGNINSLKNGIDPNNVKEGDKVYVVTEYLDIYFKEIHPKIKHKYILVTGRCDRGIGNNEIKYLDDKIIHWYSSNVEVEDHRLTQIPLGLQNRHWRIKNHPQSDIELIKEVGDLVLEKNNDILLSFQIHTNSDERRKCYNYFSKKDFVKIRNYNDKNRINREFVKDYFSEIKKSKFVLCPFGGGFDCHRNWEVFSLGSFPIIKKHKSMENFYDMPAWFVDDWYEVNKDTIENKYNELSKNKKNTDKIYFDYWYKKINNI